MILMEVTVKRVPLRISLTSAEAVTFDGTKSISESKITTRTLAISIIKPFVLHLIVQAECLVNSSLALGVSPVCESTVKNRVKKQRQKEKKNAMSIDFALGLSERSDWRV